MFYGSECGLLSFFYKKPISGSFIFVVNDFIINVANICLTPGHRQQRGESQGVKEHG